LNQTLYATIAIHSFFWLLRAFLFRRTFTRTSLLLYLFLSAPQLFIHFQFERLGRPTYQPDGTVKRSGEDLDAKGLTEYMWDVTYWTYICLVLASVLGDWAWWLYAVIPAYAVWLAWTTYTGMRGGYTDAAGVPQTQSKRQQKMEKRGGQKVQYR
jgi:hypothetical protein